MTKRSRKTTLVIVNLILLALVFAILSGCTGSYILSVPSNFIFEEKSSAIKWDAVPNSLSYELQLSKDDPAITENAEIVTKTMSETEYVLENAGITYSRVRANGNGTLLKNSEYSDWIKCTNTVRLDKLSVAAAKLENGKAVITFKHDKNAKFYDIKVYKGEKSILEQRVTNGGEETFDISFAIDGLGDYNVRYIMKGDGIFALESAQQTYIFAMKLPVPISQSFVYDKNKSEDLEIYFNLSYYSIREVFIAEKKLEKPIISIIDGGRQCLTIDKDFLSKFGTGNFTIRFATDFGDTNVTLQVIDSRNVSVDITNYFIEKNTTEGMIVQIVNFEKDIISIETSRPNFTSSLDKDKNDYSFNIITGELKIEPGFFNRNPEGDYVFTITFQDNDKIILNVKILIEGAPHLSSSQFKFNQNGGLQTENLKFSIVNLSSNMSFSFVNDDYGLADDQLSNYIMKNYNSETRRWEIEIKAAYLNNLALGDYTFGVATNSDYLSFKVNVYTDKPQISNPRLDMNISYNELFLYWDSPLMNAEFSVEYDGRVHFVSSPCISVRELTLGELTDAIKITIKGSSVFSEFRVAQPTWVMESVDYSELIYSFEGVRANYYISSFSEMTHFMEFFYFSIVKDGKMKSFMQPGGTLYELMPKVKLYIFISPSAFGGSNVSTFVNTARMKAGDSVENIRNGISISQSSASNGLVGLAYDYSTNIEYFTPTKVTSQIYEKESDTTPPCYQKFIPTRGAEYAFKLDKVSMEQEVYNSSQLYYVVENGYRPMPIEGSPAETIYNRAREVLRSIIDDDMSDYTKAHYIYDWLVTNVTYDTVIADTNFSDGNRYHQYYSFYLEGVFNQGIAVCDGISKAFVLLCSLEGIDSYRAKGDTNGGAHAWNKAQLGGEWFAFDATWGDKGSGLLYHGYSFMNEKEVSTGRTEMERYLTLSGVQSRKNAYKIATGKYNVYDADSSIEYKIANNTQSIIGALQSMELGIYYTISSTMSVASIDAVIKSIDLDFSIKYTVTYANIFCYRTA